MKDNELLNKIKKDIKNLSDDLRESSAQLGGVYYDSERELPGSEILIELINLDRKIPEIKKRMDEIKGYNLTISESEEMIKECQAKIKEYEARVGSVLEKVGVELYCFIGEKELAYEEIKLLYNGIKESEKRSEDLESKLYKLENNDVKKGFGEILTKPFKVRSVKREIADTNKQSLNKFRELGRIYCEIPALIDEETNESILDILGEYRAIDKSISVQNKSVEQYEKRISDNREKIEEGSNGLRLKTLYSRFEEEISSAQNSISENLVLLGYEVADVYGPDSGEIDDDVIKSKLEKFRAVKSDLEQKQLEAVFVERRIEYNSILKEIENKESRISIDEKHIESLKEKLEEERLELDKTREKSEEMDAWLKENYRDL